MPTPRPIIVATELAHSGISRTLVSKVSAARPTPTPNSAVASGSPIATSDPKAMNKMIAATSSPGPSAPMLVDWALSMAWPASSICTPVAASVRGEVEHLGGHIDREGGARRVELDDGVTSSAVSGDLVGTGRIPWRSDGHDVWHLTNPFDERFGHRDHRRRSHAGRRRESRSRSCHRPGPGTARQANRSQLSSPCRVT